MIDIDGSQGEGGGQILRTALGLSLVTGSPFRMTRIRAKRDRPGLLRQHLAAVHAAVAVGSARAEGDRLGSSELVFEPGTVRPGDYRFTIGTAGSTTLVFQAVLPALLTARGTSRLTLEGGTHNPHAPPFEFLDRCFLHALRRMGAQVAAKLERPGFYPAGGGSWSVEIEPAGPLQRIDWTACGEPGIRRATAIVAHLPRSVAERELARVQSRLGWSAEQCDVVEIPDSLSPGNVLLLELGSSSTHEVVVGFGEKGRPAEMVADAAIDRARAYLASRTPVGEHLADQLLIPMALAGGGCFRSLPPTRHAQTNAGIIKRFLPVCITIEPAGERQAEFRVAPR